MRQIKDVLRLNLELHHSHRHIAASLGISKGVVAKYIKLASDGGLYWPQIEAMSETELHTRLLGTVARASSFVAPDFAQMHQELRRKGMTLMLLWQEHSERHPDQTIHSYSQFCENYRRYRHCPGARRPGLWRSASSHGLPVCQPTRHSDEGSRT